MYQLQKIIIGQLLAVGMLILPFQAAAAEDQVAVEVEKMLKAVGGREAWSVAKGFKMKEILHSSARELPVVRTYWVDFEQPRIMEKSVGRNLQQVQALNRNAGWTRKDGQLTAWDDKTVAAWNGFWPGIPTRIFHLLAKNDPRIEPVWRDGVIDILWNGNRVVWIATNPRGVPVAYGREDRHSATHFLGKPLQYGDVTLWSEATEPGGNWRVEMIAYELLTESHTVSFEPPQ